MDSDSDVEDYVMMLYNEKVKDNDREQALKKAEILKKLKELNPVFVRNVNASLKAQSIVHCLRHFL